MSAKGNAKVQLVEYYAFFYIIIYLNINTSMGNPKRKTL